MTNMLFRADSSSSIGTGHIMRDLVLAGQYPGATIFFATQDLPGNLNAKIIEAGYTVIPLRSNDPLELIEVVKRLDIDTVVFDHYGIDAAYEKTLKEATGCTVFSLDDTYEAHHCDILLNHNIYADPRKYTGLVPEHCELRCGSRYTLLREEFIREKKKRKPLANHTITQVFVAMGGADHSNLNIPILKVLKRFKNF